MSQVTLPSTEGPGSPVDPNVSFRTELNDDRPDATVIPSSLTPPPSSQVGAAKRSAYSQSQQTTLASPPATVLAPPAPRDRISALDYAPPSQSQVEDASADELRAMLQACIADHRKLKTETAHHKLQLNLLNLQAEEESKRAAVEHDMVRREIDALRMAEHSRQARRELSSSADSMQSKYLETKAWYDSAMEENDTLNQRLRVAKKVIQQKEEETIGLMEERDVLLNRIRENREHFHMLCSPGGIFHGALTPKQLGTPMQPTRAAPRHSSRATPNEGREHGLSALLQAMSQDHHHQNNNTSQPSTPKQQKSTGKSARRHSRNAQSMSSLPTTPIHRTHRDGAGLLPSADLVPQTEPRMRYAERYFEPSTPKQSHQRRKSRESTISADDEEIARQALMSARHERVDPESESVYGSQASQAATEMLRRHPSVRESSPAAKGKRRLSDEAEERISPKKLKSGKSEEVDRVGLGIQY